MSRPLERFVLVVDYVMLIDYGEPSCYKKAMMHKDQHKWENVMQSEMSSLIKNKTWDLVSLPHGKQALTCKWVYKMKVACDHMPKFKAPLVFKGFKHEKHVDFEEIFSPVVKVTISDAYLD